MNKYKIKYFFASGDVFGSIAKFFEEELELINDTEILYDNVDHYLRDNFDCKAPVIKWSKNQLNLNLY